MNCRAAENLFSSFLEDELSQRERLALEGHLEECSRCSMTVEELRATVELMSALPSYETGPAFEEEVMDRIRSGEALRPSLVDWLSERLGPGRLRPVFLAGAAGCALWIAFIVMNPAQNAAPGHDAAGMKMAANSPSAPAAGAPANVPSTSAAPSGDVVASAPAAPRAPSSGAAPVTLDEGTATATATASAPAADSARVNGSAPYQDEYILDQFYLNRSGEEGVHSIVPVSGRTTDDVYITF
jgi:anti-sigma factor RsiW